MTILNWRGAATALALAALAGACADSASADAKKPVVAMSNGYYGNAWRHNMIDAFKTAAEQAKKDGRISDYLIANADGTTTQQISQLSDLILKKPDLIIIDSNSETALNGVIKKACDSGIKILAYDALVTAPCAYKLNSSFNYQQPLAKEVAELAGGKGNLLVVRGITGTSPDREQYEYQMKGLAAFPGLKKVGEVYGEWTTSIAQQQVSNVLPTLPHVDLVVTQGGGDDYGVARAFDAAGGDYASHPPIIAGGGSTDFIRWWAQKAKTGYKTISVHTSPGASTAALWMGLAILEGKKVPKEVRMPVVKITSENLSEYTSLPPGQIVSPTYSDKWVQDNLLTQ